MKSRFAKSVAIAVLLALSSVAFAGGQTVVMPQSSLKWKDMGDGVTAATVSGDMQKGPSRFFLKYPPGLVTPKHHHTADHYVTIVSGMVTITAAGKEHRLGPGDYLSSTGKASHIAKVEGKDSVVFFIQADGPWDAVMEP